MNIEKFMVKIQYALPIIVIALVAVVMIERQKQLSPQAAALAPPRMDISTLDVRGEEIWDFQ